MQMVPCPKCGAPNSIKRNGCFNCGTVLREEAGVEPAPPGSLPTTTDKPEHDRLYYGIGIVCAAWVILGPREAVMQALILPAVGIGYAAGLYARRALQQAFPERNTSLLGGIAGLIVALIAWSLVIGLRGGF